MDVPVSTSFIYGEEIEGGRVIVDKKGNFKQRKWLVENRLNCRPQRRRFIAVGCWLKILKAATTTR